MERGYKLVKLCFVMKASSRSFDEKPFLYGPSAQYLKIS